MLKRDESLASVSFIEAGQLVHPFRAVESFLPASQPTLHDYLMILYMTMKNRMSLMI
jgi:hypothetical protein